ncbi:MAG: hypothetical protein HY907_17515 [Deltaproteobacteria bacterium]|nr:hypothetical protein [Deltaproteobacteria bacterium]
MMERRRVVGITSLGLVVLLTSGIVRADEFGDHITEAITHARAAVEQGERGNLAGLEEHALMALQHARAAAEIRGDFRLDDAIELLYRAAAHASVNQLAIALENVQEALAELRAVY